MQVDQAAATATHAKSCHALAASTREATLGDTFSRSNLAIPSTMTWDVIDLRSKD